MDMSRYLDLFLSESREHLGAAHEVHSSLEHDPLQADLWNAVTDPERIRVVIEQLPC